MRFYGLLLGCLGVWRVTYLLHAEDGPARVLARARQRLGAGVFHDLVGCFYCLSVWVAIPFALAVVALEHGSWGEALLLWPALSGGAIVIERLVARDEVTPVVYREDPETGREEH